MTNQTPTTAEGAQGSANSKTPADRPPIHSASDIPISDWLYFEYWETAFNAAQNLRRQLAQMEEERDQARQDLEERCAENDRERAAHLQAYQAAVKERDEANEESRIACSQREADIKENANLSARLTAAESELAELRKDRDGSGIRNDLAITEGELKKYRDRLAFLGNPKSVFLYSVAPDGQIKVGSRYNYKLFPSMEQAIDAASNQQEKKE